MQATGNEIKNEQPLGGSAKVMLVLGALAVMLAFYVYSLLAILLLTALIGVELVVFVALARFAAARLMAPTLRKHAGLLTLLLKSFRLQKGVDFKIPLRREDAPALHEMLSSLCRRLGLAVPQEVVLQMGDGAWVRLRGVRSGAGKTTLGVGYDLLAGLTVAEMEAVLAHEMTHAKLIHRGVRNWLGNGQARIRSLANALWTQVNAARRANVSATVAKSLFYFVEPFVRLSTRLVAAYSRQNEFDADRGAAELCGAATMKSALSKLDSLHRITSRLPWNERVAQLQQTGGYSQWLLSEIAQGTITPAADSNQALFNEYSTHPLIRDRLAALPSDGKPNPADSPTAIQLLAKPDDLAGKLVTELQRLMAAQEQKDSQALEKFSRKTGRYAHLLPLQRFGVLLALVAGLIGLIGLFDKNPDPAIEGLCVVVIIAGVGAYFHGRYWDPIQLLVPGYTALVKPAADRPANDQIEEKQKAMVAELTERCRQESKGRKAWLLGKEAYAALEKCDYLRAHVAARECLKYDNKSVPGALALAVACAAHQQIPRTVQLLTFVQRKTGFTTFSTCWGTAWAALLAYDWVRAEALLEKALKLQPNQTTLISLLAIAQSRRGKVQSAIMNARRACEACPDSREMAKYLIARLLEGGHTREAQARLETVKADLDTDIELMFSVAQLHLLQRQIPEAEHWTARIKSAGPSPQMLVRLGRLYETARQKERAGELYQEALATDHYPEAHLGLARLETEQNQKPEARKHLLDALNVSRPLGKEAVGTLQLLHPILNQMLWLQDPVPSCQAWLAGFPGDVEPKALSGKNFLVYAPDLAQAQAHFQAMLDAFQPEKPPVTMPPGNWRAAPRPVQPHGPVRPGVQGLWH